MVDEVATASCERVESLIASFALMHETWRRPWPASPPVLVVSNSPADAFTTAFGVNFADIRGRFINR